VAISPGINFSYAPIFWFEFGYFQLAQDNVISFPILRNLLFHFMWLQEELLKLQVNNLSIRQQLDLLQDNAYVRHNLNSIVNSSTASSLANKDASTIKGEVSSYAKKGNFAWKNILSYLRLAFPEVWKVICDSKIIPENTINFSVFIQLQDIKAGVQSCKKVLEVFKTLVYGGSLRPHFSQNRCIQQLYTSLLFVCQSSDISGKDSISGQYRILFLQNWIEKLVNTSLFPSFSPNNTSFSSPKTHLDKKSALVSDTKYIVSKIPGFKPCSNSNIGEILSTSSSQTANTSFSSYINKHHTQSSKFVGIKIKFNSDNSSTSDTSEASDCSIWESPFKKRKTV